MLKKKVLWNVLALRWFSAELQGILHIIVYNEYDMILNWRNFQLFIHSNQMISPSEDEKLQLKHFWQYNNIIKKNRWMSQMFLRKSFDCSITAVNVEN